MAAKLMPTAGSGTEAAMAPPISACAVAVITCLLSIHHFVNLNQIREYGRVLYGSMLPVLFSIGKIPVSSFGVFLALGFLVGIFLIWRLSRAWDLDEEKILDLILLTFLGGLIGARIYFVLENINLFAGSALKIILIQKVPGLSFWGAFLGGWLTMYLFARAKKMDFWQIGDIASIGFLGALVISSIGSFLGGLDAGIHRIPVQLLEGMLLFLVLSKLWFVATHFHPRGKVLSLSLVYLGVIKLIMEPLKQKHDESSILSFSIILLGVVILYKATKRSLKLDLKIFYTFLIKLMTDSLTRRTALIRVRKYWYNQKTSFFWRIRNLKKAITKKHVRFS